ncbi:TetR/AcrR family transcriptional regulator [Haliea sp. E1-2-M8]|uniref:TetR/AcrR family transcriptional regulator n=1 Tax=Haliea sp. E1-2-M8 TaxID=3064706 RepID=UPI00271DC2C2|nr:TetR/AcrR family transcriptional regulator [Haliea sp. E1-2-M8]MDO8863995.1 TetR/AcrR family transcriptional regulator [Haliea sp. E1-2-M8]
MKRNRWGQQTRQDNVECGRDIILDAARACYAEKGVTATKLDDIARKAHISRRTVYRYFPNKHAIVQEVVDEQALVFFTRMQSYLKDKDECFPALIKSIILYVVTYGPRVPGHTMLMSSINTGETGMKFITSPKIFGYWEIVLRGPFENARLNGEINHDISLQEIIAWTARVIFSFIQFPVEKKRLARVIDRFVVTAIESGTSKNL